MASSGTCFGYRGIFRALSVWVERGDERGAEEGERGWRELES